MIRAAKTIACYAILTCAPSAYADYKDAEKSVYNLTRSTFSPATQPLKTHHPDSKNISQVQISPEVINTAYKNSGLIYVDYADGIYISIDRASQGSPGTMVYNGSLYNKDQKKSLGEALISVSNDVVYGLIRTPKSNIQITTADAGDKSSIYIIREMSETSAQGGSLTSKVISATNTKDSPPPSADIQSYTPNIYQKAASGTPSTTIDVLVLYTAYARFNNGGTSATEAWINATIADLNNKIADIGLPNHTFSVKAVLPAEYPTLPNTYYENTTHNGPNACVGANCDSIVADQYWLATDPFVASLRDSYNADLVILITAADQRHPSDFAHGFAGLHQETGHGEYNCYFDGSLGRWCGEFVTVRDAYALANFTLHHEVGHALGLRHSDGVVSFGWAGGVEETSYGNFLKPLTIMQVEPAGGGPLCLWSTGSSFGTVSQDCHARLPFFADNSRLRWMFYHGGVVPRTFGPNHQVKTKIQQGFSVVSARK